MTKENKKCCAWLFFLTEDQKNRRFVIESQCGSPFVLMFLCRFPLVLGCDCRGVEVLH